MKQTSIIFIILFIVFGFCQAQEGEKRDEGAWIWNVPHLYDNVTYWEPPSKYRQAETDDMLGKWEFDSAPNTTIEFKSDSLKRTFYFYDGVTESESSGEWRESYYDEVLIVTLDHLNIDVIEKLAVQVINKKTLALGLIVNGEYEYRYRIKKQ